MVRKKLKNFTPILLASGFLALPYFIIPPFLFLLTRGILASDFNLHKVLEYPEMEGGGEHLSPGMPFVACTGEQALAQPAPEKVIVTSLNICFIIMQFKSNKRI